MLLFDKMSGLSPFAMALKDFKRFRGLGGLGCFLLFLLTFFQGVYIIVFPEGRVVLYIVFMFGFPSPKPWPQPWQNI